MNCEEALECLSARRDGELEPELVTELEKHLQSCEKCREIAEIYENIDGELGTLETPPETLISGVMAQMAKEKPKKKRWYFGSATAVAAAAALLLVFGGTYLPKAPQSPAPEVATMMAEEPEAPAVSRAVEEPTQFMVATSAPNTLVVTDDGAHPIADTNMIAPQWPVQPLENGLSYQIDMKTARELVKTWESQYKMELIAPEDAEDTTTCYLEIIS